MNAGPRTIVAQVVLIPASGVPISGDDRITAENLARFAHDPETARSCADWFAEQGFEVGPAVGIAMSIAGPPERFASRFGRPIRLAGGDVFVVGDDEVGRELPLDALPDDVRRHVQAVVFEPPAELTDDDAAVTP